MVTDILSYVIIGILSQNIESRIDIRKIDCSHSFRNLLAIIWYQPIFEV